MSLIVQAEGEGVFLRQMLQKEQSSSGQLEWGWGERQESRVHSWAPGRHTPRLGSGLSPRMGSTWYAQPQPRSGLSSPAHEDFSYKGSAQKPNPDFFSPALPPLELNQSILPSCQNRLGYWAAV